MLLVTFLTLEDGDLASADGVGDAAATDAGGVGDVVGDMQGEHPPPLEATGAVGDATDADEQAAEVLLVVLFADCNPPLDDADDASAAEGSDDDAGDE